MNITARKLWWMWWHRWHPSHKSGVWTDDKELVWSVINAVILGVVLSVIVNWDAAHSFLRKIRVTKRTSYPSEWYSAVHRYKREVVLHLKDERRVRGWAEEYPDQCDKGHFLVQDLRWLDEDGNEYPQSEVEAKKDEKKESAGVEPTIERAKDQPPDSPPDGKGGPVVEKRD